MQCHHNVFGATGFESAGKQLGLCSFLTQTVVLRALVRPHEVVFSEAIRSIRPKRVTQPSDASVDQTTRGVSLALARTIAPSEVVGTAHRGRVERALKVGPTKGNRYVTVTPRRDDSSRANSASKGHHPRFNRTA
jgi:hypothetical protein